MEIQLSTQWTGGDERTTSHAISVDASGACFVGQVLATPRAAARLRSMPAAGPAGGVYHVPAFVGLSTKTPEIAADLAFIDPRPTDNFMTRQGPPTCSPPV